MALLNLVFNQLSSANAQHQKVPLDDIEELLQIVVGGQERIKTVWPGYWEQDKPFAIYLSDGHIWFRSNEEPTAHINQFTSWMEQPNIYAGKISVDWMTRPFSFERTVAGLDMLVAQYADDFTLDILFHEGFHKYQIENWELYRRPQLPSDDNWLTPELWARKEVEKQILLNLLSDLSLEKRERLLSVYFVLRRARTALQPHSVTELEQYYERREGVAQYVGAAMRERALNLPRNSYMFAQSSRLNSINSGADLQEEYYRWDAYSVGGPLTYLISQYASDRDWRAALKQGDNPYTLLYDLAGSKLADGDEMLLLDTFGYAEFLKVGQSLLQANETFGDLEYEKFTEDNSMFLRFEFSPYANSRIEASFSYLLSDLYARKTFFPCVDLALIIAEDVSVEIFETAMTIITRQRQEGGRLIAAYEIPVNKELIRMLCPQGTDRPCQMPGNFEGRNVRIASAHPLDIQQVQNKFIVDLSQSVNEP